MENQADDDGESNTPEVIIGADSSMQHNTEQDVPLIGEESDEEGCLGAGVGLVEKCVERRSTISKKVLATPSETLLAEQDKQKEVANNTSLQESKLVATEDAKKKSAPLNRSNFATTQTHQPTPTPTPTPTPPVYEIDEAEWDGTDIHRKAVVNGIVPNADIEEPGAYAVGGGQGTCGDPPTSTDMRASNTNTNIPMPPIDHDGRGNSSTIAPEQQQQYNDDDEEAAGFSTSGLAVAHPVVPVAPSPSLQVATQVPNTVAGNNGKAMQDAEATRQRQRRPTRIAIGIIGILAVAIGIVVLVVVLLKGGSSSTSDDNNESSSNDNANTSWSNLMSLLPDETVTTISTKPDSPQGLAANFIISDPELPTYPSWRIHQRFALATLYYATNGPESWKKQDGWLDLTRTVHECDWYAKSTHGITIAGRSMTDLPFPCEGNDDGIYRHLWLWNNGLQGSIPAELFLLTNLLSISIYSNDLEGSIPSEIGLASNLAGFNAGKAGLDGTLPSELWQLSSIWALILSNNELQGTLPTEVGILSSLEFFILDSNQFSGSIPSEIGKLLETFLFILHSNNFEGTIPTEVGLFSKVHSFDLSNRPESVLPEHLSSYNNTNKPCGAAGRNCLTGTIPTELGNLHYVHRLDLADNLLTATIPTEIGKLSLLENMELAANYLTGSIPSQLGELSNLEDLDLGNNMLTSTFPSELRKLVNMTLAFFYNNPNLTGSIPPSYSSAWTRLKKFDAVGCPMLTGTVPEVFCTLSHVGFDCSPTTTLCGCDCPCG